MVLMLTMMAEAVKHERTWILGAAIFLCPHRRSKFTNTTKFWKYEILAASELSMSEPGFYETLAF